MKLIEAARATPKSKISKTIENDERELALAWLRGELSSGQVNNVYQLSNSGNVLYRIAIVLRDCYSRGILKEAA